MILSILPVLATVLNFVGRGTPRQDTTCARCKELERERNILRTERGYWKDLHRRAKEREESLRAELEETKAKLKQREQQLFGRSSERSKGDDTKDSARSSEAPEKKKRGQRPKLEGGKAPTGRRQHGDRSA